MTVIPVDGFFKGAAEGSHSITEHNLRLGSRAQPRVANLNPPSWIEWELGSLPLSSHDASRVQKNGRRSIIVALAEAKHFDRGYGDTRHESQCHVFSSPRGHDYQRKRIEDDEDQRSSLRMPVQVSGVQLRPRRIEPDMNGRVNDESYTGDTNQWRDVLNRALERKTNVMNNRISELPMFESSTLRIRCRSVKKGFQGGILNQK